MRYHQYRWLSQLFSINEDDFIDLPAKISGTMIARYTIYPDCTICFPHGRHTPNATMNKNRKNWKNSRKTKWRA